jgi:ketosteroid isomerase-like protein
MSRRVGVDSGFDERRAQLLLTFDGRRKMARFWIGSCLLVAAGCAAPTQEPALDLEAERRALMEVDAAFFASHEDVDEFLTFMADDATFMPADAPLARGDAIRATWEQLLALPGFDLEWSASSAHVAEAGDMGYTIGTYELTVEREGAAVVTAGKYVTLWRKQDDGSWKVVVDCFNADGPPVEA